ncbi:transcriptional regulator [Flavimobilis marinus]|uniref:Glucokinase n=1 Tax=Flavimobilis marinus TaxID=285351 RepID=A0A1I2GLV4_9MICO|nr:ROK family protein [Flavimobilis marinus]GHG56016.1 transcriptional regulator [Flavimobilis marinus]SFF18462.1 glucokinase [Flavimobilis marinus]
MDLVLALDLGGTKIAAALVDRNGRVGEVVAVPTPALDGPAAIVAAATGALGEVLARGWDGSPVAAAAGEHRVRGLGVGTAGVVDVAAGTIVSATDTLAGWTGTPLRGDLERALAALTGARLPVHVLNDVDAHALGEVRHGAAAGAASALVVGVGTGIGAGVVVRGELLRGAHHVAGEMGHLPVAGADHLRCPCGRSGHLEAIGSGVGMYRHYLSLGGDPEVGGGRGVAERAAAGDPLAGRALRDSAAAVGRGIAAVVTVLDPGRVVVTGGVPAAGSAWWSAMDEALRGQLIDILANVPVVSGKLGGTAPLAGAAAAVRQLIDTEGAP